jgi:hypothetical protein
MDQHEKFNGFIEDLERTGHPDVPPKIYASELE